MSFANNVIFGPTLLLLGILIIAGQLKYTESGGDARERIVTLLRAVPTGGKAGEGRVAAAGFALIVGGILGTAALAYRLLAHH